MSWFNILTLAVTKLLIDHKNNPNLIEYIANLNQMHKVILHGDIIQTKDILTRNNILFSVWLEQPENIETCLCLVPYEKDEVKEYLKDSKLF